MIRIGLDLHNLSTRADLSLRTGIQQVIFALLDSQFRMRGELDLGGIELLPLPMLPLHFGKSSFSNLSPSHVNNSNLVLEEVASELNLDSKSLWLNAIGSENKNWTDEDFYRSCANLDWLIITGLCEFRHIGEKLKAINPGLKIAVLVYDLGPIKRPELVAEGMTQWFQNCYLESIRIYADLVFTISRHTAIECAEYFSTWPNFEAPIFSTPLPAEPPALRSVDDQRVNGFLSNYGLKKGKFFVAIGTIEPRKNLGIGVLGFNFFCQFDQIATHEYRFVIIGKQGWRNEDVRILEMIGDRAECFVFPGYLPREEVELAIILSAGLVMPSRLEGFGLPIALATMYGVPTVTCNNTSLPEASGVTSCFVTTDSADKMGLAMWHLAMASAMRELPRQQDLLANLTQNRRDWDQFLKGWIDCIESIHSKK
jgi:glycosyltransferase involved in cell wall biosynthesis